MTVSFVSNNPSGPNRINLQKDDSRQVINVVTSILRAPITLVRNVVRHPFKATTLLLLATSSLIHAQQAINPQFDSAESTAKYLANQFRSTDASKFEQLSEQFISNEMSRSGASRAEVEDQFASVFSKILTDPKPGDPTFNSPEALARYMYKNYENDMSKLETDQMLLGMYRAQTIKRMKDSGQSISEETFDSRSEKEFEKLMMDGFRDGL